VKKTIDEYIGSIREDLQDNYLKVREFILDSHIGITESMKYGVPFYALNHNLCFLSATKNNEIQVGFWQGLRLKETSNLITGHELKIVRHFTFKEFSETEFINLATVLDEAIELDKTDYNEFKKNINVYRKKKV
jgi:hypothetical protein